jgi:hypothetical protein
VAIKRKIYSLICFQCRSGFLSSMNLDIPICGKSLDSTVDYEKVCIKRGNRGVIYRKEICHCCYFRFEKKKKLYDRLDQCHLCNIFSTSLLVFDSPVIEFLIVSREVSILLEMWDRLSIFLSLFVLSRIYYTPAYDFALG